MNALISANPLVALFLASEAGQLLAADPEFIGSLNTAMTAAVPAKGKDSKAPRKGSLREKGEGKKKAEEFKVLIPATGKLSAVDFLTALRESGMVPTKDANDAERFSATGEVLKHYDSAKARADEKEALIGFIGWTNEAHGTQLDRATLHARFLRLPTGGISLPHRSWEARQAKASISAEGFVAGLPRFAEKMLMDLGARERVAVEDLATSSALLDCLGKPATETSAEESPNPIRFERILVKMAQEDDRLAKVIRATVPAEVPGLLMMMVATAEGALAQIRADIDGIDPFSVASVEHCHKVLHSRGQPLLVERIALQGEMAVE